MKAPVFEIKRFAVHDGDGIRTTVFLKGCTLKCVWCHNPEGIGFAPQIACYKDKCIHCGRCVQICPNGAHKMEDGIHSFDRSKCLGCGLCAEQCLGQALAFYGRERTPEEILPILLEDRDFYENSDGGVTISGGECLCHADFCAQLLKLLKAEKIHTAVDTCGFISKEAIDKVIPYTDIFLFDVKAYDSEVHQKCTGYSNEKILENLRYIDICGKTIEVRIPYVPGFNSLQIDKIGQLLSGIKHLKGVRVLPYHNYAGSKYASLDMENTLPKDLPDEEEIEMAREILKTYGLKVLV